MTRVRSRARPGTGAPLVEAGARRRRPRSRGRLARSGADYPSVERGRSPPTGPTCSSTSTKHGRRARPTSSARSSQGCTSWSATSEADRRRLRRASRRPPRARPVAALIAPATSPCSPRRSCTPRRWRRSMSRTRRCSTTRSAGNPRRAERHRRRERSPRRSRQPRTRRRSRRRQPRRTARGARRRRRRHAGARRWRAAGLVLSTTSSSPRRASA